MRQTLPVVHSMAVSVSCTCLKISCFLSYIAVDTTQWKKQDVTGYGVKGRRSHCAACIGSSVLYFGGYNATTKEHFGDVFIVDTGIYYVMSN